MDLLLTDEQQELQDSFIKGVAKELPLDRLHDASHQHGDEKALKIFADLGWLRVGLSEDLGGIGLGRAEEILLFREIGRNLGPLSVLAGVLSGRIAALSGQGNLAETILNAETNIGLVIPESDQSLAAKDERSVRLFSSGSCNIGILILPDKASLFAFPQDDGASLPCLDETLVMRRYILENAQLIAQAKGPDIWLQGLLLTAAMLVGQSEATRDMILEYAKVRQTFGRPIGAYQAVRHPIAEMTARGEHARCLTYYASLALDMGRPDAAMQVAAARAIAQEAAAKNADANIQLHGAVGITDELNAHHFLKRSMMLSNFLGGKKSVLRQVLTHELMEV